MNMLKSKTMIIALLVFTAASCDAAQNNDQRPQGNPPTIEQLFKEMDANKDGKLALKEVKGPLKDDFSKIDTNKDGFITKEELEKAPKPQRKGPPEKL